MVDEKETTLSIEEMVEIAFADEPLIPPKTVWEELEVWASSLPNWQRFLISIAVKDGSLSNEQIDAAYRIFLRDNDLDIGTEELSEIPSTVTGRSINQSTKPLILRELNSLKNVNAIPETSSIQFGDNLTVVYGHNGAGKSGFSRVLSTACFSRSKPKIIPDIYSSETSTGVPRAQFTIEDGSGDSEVINFELGDENPELQRVSVFDSSVARIHLSSESELGFQPVGFDVFDELLRAVEIICQKTDSDISSKERPNKFHQLFTGTSPISEALAKLSARSDIQSLQTAAKFGEEEATRLEEVTLEERELLAKSPVETLKNLAKAKTDLRTLTEKISQVAEQIDGKSCKTYREMLDQQRLATTSAEKAGAEVISNPQLKQMGSQLWDNFVDASRQLAKAESDDYPNEGDPCLLCLRPLDLPSKSLILRMWGYLDADQRKKALECDEKINACTAALKSLVLDLLPADSRMRSDLSKISPEIVALFDQISNDFLNRRESIIAAMNAGKIEEIPADSLNLRSEEISKEIERITAQETALNNGEFTEAIAKNKDELDILKQRQILSKNIEDVVNYIEGLRWADKARKAKPNTRFVTDKRKGLFKLLIEGAYKANLEQECENLDCALPIDFTARGSSGKTLRALKAKDGYKPEEIFSEGEQRALAIADFLTEVNLNPSSAAVVFDDPVTSLDHTRKKRIARRLVEESRRRQVIVFSHDIVFLTMLTDLSNSRVHPSTKVHWIERDHQGAPGNVKLDASPTNRKTYLKTQRAKELLARAKKADGQDRVDFLQQGAGALRRTIEETIIYELFNGTVRRWDEQVRVGNLREMFWTEEIAMQLSELHGDISRIIEGHSHSDEYTGGTHDPDDLEKLIENVDKIKEEITKGQRNKK